MTQHSTQRILEIQVKKSLSKEFFNFQLIINRSPPRSDFCLIPPFRYNTILLGLSIGRIRDLFLSFSFLLLLFYILFYILFTLSIVYIVSICVFLVRAHLIWSLALLCVPHPCPPFSSVSCSYVYFSPFSIVSMVKAIK